jgi:hypothetical protein
MAIFRPFRKMLPGFQFDRLAATVAALVVVGLAVYLLIRNEPISIARAT